METALEFEAKPAIGASIVFVFEKSAQNVVLIFVKFFLIVNCKVAKTLHHRFEIVRFDVFTKVAKKAKFLNEAFHCKTVVQCGNIVLCEWLDLGKFAKYFVAFVFSVANSAVAHHQKYKYVLEDVENLVVVFFALFLAEIYVHFFVVNVGVGKQVFGFCPVFLRNAVLSAVAGKL